MVGKSAGCYAATKDHVGEVQLLARTDVCEYCEYMIGRNRQVLKHHAQSQPLFLSVIRAWSKVWKDICSDVNGCFI